MAQQGTDPTKAGPTGHRQPEDPNENRPAEPSTEDQVGIANRVQDDLHKAKDKNPAAGENARRE
jgi:hypothetical protein